MQQPPRFYSRNAGFRPMGQPPRANVIAYSTKTNKTYWKLLSRLSATLPNLFISRTCNPCNVKGLPILLKHWPHIICDHNSARCRGTGNYHWQRNELVLARFKNSMPPVLPNGLTAGLYKRELHYHNRDDLSYAMGYTGYLKNCLNHWEDGTTISQEEMGLSRYFADICAVFSKTKYFLLTNQNRLSLSWRDTCVVACNLQR